MKNVNSLFLLLKVILLTIISPMNIQAQTKVLLHTTAGDMKILLYEDTQKHRDNFIKLVQQGYYDGILFHRVIAEFMIQAGDPNSRSARPGQPLGDGGPDYTIPAEFFPQYFHKKGVIAAARLGDQVNPLKESSGSQFYIVQGKKLTDSQLDSYVGANKHLPFTPEQRLTYTTLGGVPQLDNAYTIFGEVIEGFEVIDKISSVTTDQRNRPVSDIKIIKASLSQ